MLYVFLVDTGMMLAFDMNLAVECVSQLKEVISRAYRIPEDKQVLLISGGESLDPSSRVCSYSAGTDTNPIFLFSKSTIESSVPPSPSVDHGSESDLREQVDGSLNLPPTYMTVVARAQLAQQFHDVARDETRICERLVHDQHLQQQGWAAVVANLEDISSAFKTRTDVFEQSFQAYLESRDQHVKLLQNFGNDLDLLSRIPVLRPLLKGGSRQIDEQHPEKVQEDFREVKDVIEKELAMETETTSLLQWINSKDQQSSLECMAEQCVRGLDQFDGETYEGLRAEMVKTLESVDNPGMKEVKGLEDRLYGLEQLMQEARRLVQEQSDLASAFVQNQTRASNLGDTSVLPDLCTSHRKQLMVMLQNHKQLQDIRRRCVRAKEELSVNLHARLRWIMYVERTMSEVDSKLVIYHENLKRLKRHLKVIQQIHLAPSIYLAFVVEVVRRRSFSHTFLQWSRQLSSRATEIYKKEVLARKEFLLKVGKHFLYALFPGLDDFPPPFALQAPCKFDGGLPDIRPSDVDSLRVNLPEMASSLVVPDVDQQMPEIVIAAATTTVDVKCETIDKDLEQESEPDTEEFEKLENAAPPATRPAEDNEVLQRIPLSASVNNSQQPTEHKEERQQDLEPEQQQQPVDLSCAVYTSASHDFFTADFYIDESMPSSYTESNATGGHLHASRTFAGHQVIKSHNVIVSELQSRLDQKESAMTQLQEETYQSQIRIQQLEDKLRRLQMLESETITKLRRDVAEAREFILHSRNNFLCHVVALAAQVSDMTEIVRQRVCTEHDVSLKNALTEAKSEHTNVVAKICSQLELESSKLRDACLEVDRYQDQLQQGSEMLDHLKGEMANQLEEQRERLNAERDEVVKRMTLEHELELENLLETQRADSNETQTQIGQLQTELDNKSKELTNLMTHYTALEESLSQKFQLQKEEITKILAEQYAEKERRTAEEIESRLHREAEEQLDNLRRTLTVEWEEARRVELQAELEKNRRELAEEHRQEIQALRARCRLAFTTTMERSPSDGSLEKIERPDSADPSRLEQLRQELTECTAALEEQRRCNERLRREKDESARAMQASFTAQKQVIFNEAIGRATSEKDRVITELRCMLRVAQSELENEQEVNAKLRSTASTSVRCESPLPPPHSDGHHSLPTPLRSPIEETFQMVSPTMLPCLPLFSSTSTAIEQSSSGVSSMIASMVNNPTQERSTNVFDATMSTSTLSGVVGQIQSDKVAVFTCHVGDLVLFCFNEKHDNYIVFSVGSTLHFLHADSLEALSLVSNEGEQRRSWTLAEITDKEYCEVKKVPNRYKLVLGTRFYRVKAKPWLAPKREARSKSKAEKSCKAACHNST